NGQDVEAQLKRTLGDLNRIPMMPDVAVKAMTVAQDPRSSLAQLASMIEKDVVLAAGILRLANSSLYSVGRAIGSLDQAVVRLGLRECQNLIVAVGMRSLFRQVVPATRRHAEALWHHAFLTAILCRHVNRTLLLGYQGEEFSAGLSHDIGRLLLAIGAPTYFQSADPMDFCENADILKREQEVLGTDHCLLGAWFARQNKLPDTIIGSVEHHHQPDAAGEAAPLVALVALADDMANHAARGEATDSYEPGENRGWTILTSDWSEEQTSRARATLPGILQSALEETTNVQGLAVA
ncbi:MAG TPA: HDOD domain-containing protein, partial [Gemmataceae bacterium]|nr:HDOD domain-containing protein [Gemmataceae bacterium]